MPRLVPLAGLCAHLSLRESSVRRLIRRGVIPGALPGTKRFDLKAVDAALDAAMGLAKPGEQSEADRFFAALEDRP